MYTYLYTNTRIISVRISIRIMYTDIYKRKDIYIYTYMYMYMYIYMLIYTCINTYRFTFYILHMIVHVHLHIHGHIGIHMHIHIHVLIHRHVHIHIHMHLRISIHIHACVGAWCVCGLNIWPLHVSASCQTTTPIASLPIQDQDMLRAGS